ncbi:MAG: alcohol dehydrogenase catalytic domain-containing protein [Christensenellales bacterium]
MPDVMKGLFCSGDWDPKPGLELTEYEKTTGKTRRGNMIWRNCKLEYRKDIPVVQPGPDDVLLKVKGVGICGTDVAFTDLDSDGYMEFPGHCRMNIVLGHEFCGEVIEAGANVTNVKVGDYVASETMGWCGTCDPCRAGYHNQCLHLDEVGITQNGGMAEYCTVPAKWVYNMNGIVEKYGKGDDAWVRGAMVEPICVAFNSIIDKAGGIRIGTTSLVFGAGAIGLMSVAILKVAGSSKIICVETKESRRQAALKMGADVVYNPIELAEKGISMHDVIMKETNGKGIDNVVEASGLPHIVLPGVISAMGIYSQIIQIGISRESAQFNYTPLQMKGCKLSFCIGSSAHNSYNDAINLQASGLIDVMPAIGGIYDIDDYERAFEEAKQGTSAKVMFVYR